MSVVFSASTIGSDEFSGVALILRAIWWLLVGSRSGPTAD
jgi:hypothetical protein